MTKLYVYEHKSSKQQKKLSKVKKYFFLLFCVTLSLILYFTFRSFNTKQKNAKLTIVNHTLNHAPKYIKEAKYYVLVKNNKFVKTKKDVYLKSLTGNEFLYESISDVEMDRNDANQYQNGYIYLIRKNGNEGDLSNPWTDELWRYDEYGKGHKIAASKGIGFLVSPDNKFIAATVDPNPQNQSITTSIAFAIYNSDGIKLKSFTESELGHMGVFSKIPFQWIGHFLWAAEVADFGIIHSLSKVNADTSQVVASYDVSFLTSLGGFSREDVAINPQVDKIAWSEHADFKNNIKNDQYYLIHRPIALYVSDLVSGTKHLIAQTNIKWYHPVWLDKQTLSFDSKDNMSKIQIQNP